MKNWHLSRKILVPMILGGVGLVALVLFVMSAAKQANMEQAGLNTAEALSNQIVTLRKFYTTQVASRAKTAGMALDYDFATRDKTLPLPATLVKALGEQLAADHPGLEVRLYSRHPFPFRAATEKYDQFEKDSLDALEKNPKVPVSRMETINGRLSIRYAVADVMQPACVDCHNNHPLSPKRDWKVGDVRGVVEVSVPIDHVAAVMNAGTAKMASGIVVGVIVLILVLMSLIRGAVVRPLRSTIEVLEAVADGDLTRHLDSDHADEVGQVGRALNLAVAIMRDTIVAIDKNVVGLVASSEQLSTASSEQVHGAEAQRDQARAVATALEEMSKTVEEISENARRSASVSTETADAARSGGHTMETVAEAMQVISNSVRETTIKVETLGHSSERVGQIVRVIEDIADQTNLLALNAAIEAARAGEQGRGFAVVADEVRKLAERSRKATEEIGQIIGEIRSGVKDAVDSMHAGEGPLESGVSATSRARADLSSIIEKAKNAGDMIGQIAVAVTQQSSATAEVNQSIERISTVTQETADSAQQTEKAAHDLASLGADLRKLVDHFEIGASERGRQPSAERRKAVAASAGH